ncbi:ATP adenylyltransferase family protein [Marinobacterium sp. YM272]|uniref:ATP adenylyltransferase family protein n=1 Tax=Marinobacterium sp. YM272 TaxID=3421654 RepID=UPI003D7F3A4D
MPGWQRWRPKKRRKAGAMADLLSRVHKVSQDALASGALEPIPTCQEVVEEQGVEFLLRVLDNLSRKDEARDKLKRAGAHRTDPFLPYDPALYVEEVAPRHRCLLNKFNVVQHHVLIVTREFEPQTDLLDAGDFQALVHCMAQMPGLGFFNGGEMAGASQPHKHLQLIPLPMAPFDVLPFSASIAEVPVGGPQCCPALLFRHGLIRFPSSPSKETKENAQVMLRAYLTLRTYLDLGEADPYNLLVTDEWMMLVPRSQEKWQGISFNALAFCGAMLVRDGEQASLLKKEGLMQALAAVT